MIIFYYTLFMAANRRLSYFCIQIKLLTITTTILLLLLLLIIIIIIIIIMPDLHEEEHNEMRRGVCPSVCRVPRPNSKTERPIGSPKLV